MLSALCFSSEYAAESRGRMGHGSVFFSKVLRQARISYGDACRCNERVRIEYASNGMFVVSGFSCRFADDSLITRSV